MANPPSKRRPKRVTTRPSPGSRTFGSGSNGGILGFVLGAACVAAAGGLYLHNQHDRPVPAPVEPVTPAPLVKHVPSPHPSAAVPAPTPVPAPATSADASNPPFSASEDVFESGARTYHSQCAQCHGTPGHEAADHGQGATQYFARSADPARVAKPSASYKAIAHGVPMTAMPAYKGKLTDRQMWQLALLLQASSAEMPNPVVKILNGK